MANNTDYSRYFQGLYNISGFDGTIESDFLKLGQVPDDRKSDLIDYNVNGFDQYRTALQNYLKSVYPLDYNNFAASDLGQMLVEMFAYMSSVIALRADMTANEMYIDTVKNEDNLKRLFFKENKIEVKPKNLHKHDLLETYKFWDYKDGKQQVLNFLVGQVMRKTKGRSNPNKLKEIFRKKLSV